MTIPRRHFRNSTSIIEISNGPKEIITTKETISQETHGITSIVKIFTLTTEIKIEKIIENVRIIDMTAPTHIPPS